MCWEYVFLSRYQVTLLSQSLVGAEGSSMGEAGGGLEPHPSSFSTTFLSDF